MAADFGERVRAPQGWRRNVCPCLIVATALFVFYLPHGYINNEPWYVGTIDDDAMTPPGLHTSAHVYARLLVSMMCVLAHASQFRTDTNHLISGFAKRTSAVVSIAAVFLMIEGLRTTRMGEIFESSTTGSGIWCIPAFVFTTIAN